MNTNYRHSAFGPEYSSDNAGDGPVGNAVGRRNKERGRRMQDKESWHAMETEQADQPVPVDEWTKFVEMMAGCKKEEISPAIWKYVRKWAVTTSSKLTRFSAKLSSGACAVSGWACVAALIVLIVMSRVLEKMMNRQEVIAEAKPVQMEPEEAMTKEAEQANAEPDETDDWSATVGATATTTVNWGALTPERVCKEVERGQLKVDACPVNTLLHGCLTLQDSFINRQLTRSNPITLGRIRRRRRRRRRSEKAAATITALATVTPEAVSVEAEAEPTETVLEETEAVEAEAMEEAADEVEEAVIEEAVVARAEPEGTVLEETTMETYDRLSSVDLDKVKKYPSLYCRQEIKKS